MNEYGPARGAPPDFNECQYCNKRFASGAARRSHEETSNFCIAQQVMGRMLREIQINDGGQHEAKKQKQEPAADEWEDLGGDNRDAEEEDGGDTWDPEEEAPQPFEAQVDAMVEAAFEEEGEGGAAESDTGGLNEGGPSKTEREFDSVEELVLAFQTAGRKQRPLTPAGMYRILRVLNHEDYDPSEVAKELKDAGRVTKMLAEMTIATVSIRSSTDMEKGRSFFVSPARIPSNPSNIVMEDVVLVRPWKLLHVGLVEKSLLHYHKIFCTGRDSPRTTGDIVKVRGS